LRSADSSGDSSFLWCVPVSPRAFVLERRREEERKRAEPKGRE